MQFYAAERMLERRSYVSYHHKKVTIS